MTHAKQTIFGALIGWLKKESHQKQLLKILAGMKPKDLERAQKLVPKQKASTVPADDSLQKYVRWYTAEKKKRSEFLGKLPAASPTLRKTKEQLQQVILRAGEPLSSKEIDGICKNEESFATYLVSLSVEQLESLKQALRDNVIRMDPPVKQTLIKLLTMVQEERFAFEKERMQKIGPQALRLGRAMAIHERIVALDKIQASLSPKNL